MARSGKDHFEIATRAMEKTLRNDNSKFDKKEKAFYNWKKSLEEYVALNKTHKLGINAFIEVSQKYPNKLKEFFEMDASFSRVVFFLQDKFDSLPVFTGMPDRESWLKNKALMAEKEAQKWDKPARTRQEKPAKIEKKVEIIQALYGLQEIKFIDITSKIIIGQKVNNDLAGEDPCPKKKKNVIIRAVVDGVEGDFTFVEGKKIIF